MAKGAGGYRIRTITCRRCGVRCTKRMPEGRIYCSLACYRDGPRPQRKTGEARECAHCDAPFYVPRGRLDVGEGKFCSLACHNANQGRGKTEHACKVCGGTFRWSPSRTASGNYRITYCSLTCRDADPDRHAMLMAMNARQQLRRMTRAEAAGYAMLDGLGVDYERQMVFGGKFTPDAVVPTARLVVQFDGDYWHDRKGGSVEPRIMRRVALDRSQDAYVRASGWEVARFWASDLERDTDACTQRLTQLLHRPLGGEPSRDPLVQGSGRNAAVASADQ